MRVLVVFGLCLALVFVWERVDIVRLGYHIERLKTEKARLERDRDHLRMQVSALTAPDRIAKVATEQLGMVVPRAGQVVMVEVRPASAPAHRTLPGEIRIARHDVNDAEGKHE
ncbi:MAG: cell division protein FtsL [Nitrospira sp.]|nr:cell division protein FtsL [Nitrospira sp.]